jgi:N-acetylglucosaminyldiphosphoundecaprenol N-acetyl-beta-D-mannosaminyltransferase
MAVASDTGGAHAAPTSRVDFDRPVVCILGLPFDAISVEDAVRHIRDAAFNARRCFVSTPNLNFAIAARSDEAFRDSVLRSDLSLVDGMPLVWVARLLGLPISERVSGADVFEALQAHPGPALTVYLFGGLPGVAGRACERINARGGGVRCVGFDTPGFGSIESMSSAHQIERINASGAHFVVVALGARKGQEWIEYNAPRLTAPVLSHLGAVVNFAAGSVRRAPRWMQGIGLEWLWRIREEPALWRRYWQDGIESTRLLCTRVLPDVLRSCAPGPLSPRPRRIERHEALHGITLALHGSWQHHDDLGELREALTRCADGDTRPTIDLADVTDVGNAFVALLLIAHGWFGARTGLRVVGASDAVCATFRNNLAEKLLREAG